MKFVSVICLMLFFAEKKPMVCPLGMATDRCQSIGAVGFGDDTFSDIADQILACLRAGDAKNLTKYFSDNVVLSILGENGTYSRFQSEIILNGFFRQYQPKVAKQTQRIGNNSKYVYITYVLEADKSSFRIFLKVTTATEKHLVEELRIDKL